MLAAEERLRQATHRTLLLSVTLVVASLAAVAAEPPTAVVREAPFHMEWWMLALAFALAELAVFHLEINHEAHTFTLSEVPIVLALFFATPAAFVVGRLVGEAFALVAVERQALSKLLFNLSMFLAETCAAIVVFWAVLGDAPFGSSRSWLAAFLAVLAADVLSMACVSFAIRWHGAQPEPGKLLRIGAATATTNTTIALTASLVLASNSLAIVLLLVLVAVAFFAYRSFAALTQRYSSLRLLYDFSTVVGGSKRADSVLQALLQQARKLLRTEVAEIVLRYSPEETFLVRMASGGNAVVLNDLPEGSPRLRLREWTVEHERTLVVPRGTKEDHLREWAASLDVKDLIAAPLRAEGVVVGTIMVADRLGEVSTFDSEDARLFETLANHASVALENGRLLDRLSTEVAEREYQALHDALTGLPNRVMFFRSMRDLVEARSADRAPFAVLLMDLDRFKEVNDTLGHHCGDLLLEEVGRRMISFFGSDALVARLGGDEFALLLPDAGDREAVRSLAARLLGYLRQPCYIESLTIEVGGSVGIAIWPEHGSDASTLLKRADVAMYAAKGTADRVSVYSVDSDDYSPRRLALASSLRSAIEGGQIEVWYQPKIRVGDGLPIGAEALVRWRHPTLGWIPPDEFLPIAEQGGLIGDLTVTVLDHALAAATGWRDEGLELDVSVNLAVQSLLDERLIDEIQVALDRVGLPASILTLEITETGVMSDPRRTLHTLERLSELGMQLSIDDFGTGYSSLSYLQRLPVHEVKIDRSFVTTMGIDRADATIVQSVIDLGRNLRLRVVAEGVEDELALERLSLMGCDVAQGHHIARPMPGDQVPAWALRHQLRLPAELRVVPPLEEGTTIAG